MGSFNTKRTVLVPIFDGDVSEETVAVASALLSRAGSQLVLLHVTPPVRRGAAPAIPATCTEPERRWHRLALATAPNRTFIDAVSGDPAAEVLAQAERFRCDVLVLDPPAAVGPANAWIDRAIARLLRAAPREAYIASRRARPPRTAAPTHPNARRAFHQERSHAAQHRVRLAFLEAHR